MTAGRAAETEEISRDERGRRTTVIRQAGQPALTVTLDPSDRSATLRIGDGPEIHLTDRARRLLGQAIF